MASMITLRTAAPPRGAAPTASRTLFVFSRRLFYL
jgi:hypothetical protein